ncbi:MAG: porin [Hyphomicrobiaceae bacterium]|nr:porin [Hyphomicrobiaceae bacterium]
MKKIAIFAAAMMAASAASAADLASKKPVEAADYVKICDAYGAGFFYIPGGETCLKIGGYVRYDLLFGVHNDGHASGGRIGAGWAARGGNGTFTRARAQVNFDARTNTEAGLLRSYINLQFNGDSAGTGGLTVDRAFIQWGGLTAGRTASMFDFWTGNAMEPIFGTASSDYTTNLLAYTAAFGNGVSATLSVEDGTFRRVGGTYGGHKLPDLVANVNVTQAWGSAQVMGAVHQIYNGNTRAAGADNILGTADDVFTGGTGSKAGWAVGAGATVNVPFLGAGSSLSLQAAYANGAIAYLSDNIASGADYSVVGTAIKATTGYSIAGGLNIVLNPKLSLAFDGSYMSIDPAGASNTVTQWDLAASASYEATPGLTFTLGLDYENVKDKAVGGVDGNALAGSFRIQRTF